MTRFFNGLRAWGWFLIGDTAGRIDHRFDWAATLYSYAMRRSWALQGNAAWGPWEEEM